MFQTPTMCNIVLSIYNYDDKTAKQQLNLTKYQHGFLQNLQFSNEIKFEKSKKGNTIKWHKLLNFTKSKSNNIFQLKYPRAFK